MSEETQEVVEELSDKEMNFRKLEARAEAAEARLAELAPLAVEKAVRSAGFDPDTPEGRALTRIAASDADADAVKGLAEELGFEASKSQTQLSPNERAAQEFGNRTADLNSVTTSDEPQSLDQLIAEADAAGNLSQGIALRTRKSQQSGLRV